MNKIAILTVHTKNLEPITKYTLPVTQKYCTEHRYDFITVQADIQYRDASWYKLNAVMRFLSLYDYIFVLDADAILQNHTRVLEQIIVQSPKSLILVCDDAPNGGLINCGTFFVKNHTNVYPMLLEWYARGAKLSNERNNFYEQDALKSLLQNEWADKFKGDVIKMFPINTFNSHWIDIPVDNLVAHVMARSIQDKVPILKGYYDKIMHNG